jgi:hypothetical protein
MPYERMLGRTEWAFAFACLLTTATSAAADEPDDPTRPVTNVDLRPHYEDDAVSSRLDRITLILRRNDAWSLDQHLNIATRLDLPLVTSNGETKDEPHGNFHTGFGRALMQAYVADLLDDRWAFAIGSQLVAPASGSAYGSGNWDMRPILAARYMLPEISDGSYFVAEARYAITVGQSFATRARSELQLSPQLKMFVGRGWFVELFPSADIRMNFGEKASGQTGRLFLPLDGEVGYNIGDSRVVSVEVSAPVVRDYPLYRLKIEARFSVRL